MTDRQLCVLIFGPYISFSCRVDSNRVEIAIDTMTTLSKVITRVRLDLHRRRARRSDPTDCRWKKMRPGSIVVSGNKKR